MEGLIVTVTMRNEQPNTRLRAAKKQKHQKPVPRFVLSARKSLAIEATLLDTLSLDEDLLRRSAPGKPDLNRFLAAAEGAWCEVRQAVESGEVNAILWLRQMLVEAHSMGLWIPSGFLLRLRQLERRDLAVEGEAHTLPAYAGLPPEFAECCRFLGIDLAYIVPSLSPGRFEDCRERGADATAIVAALVDAWRALPVGVEAGQAREFLIEFLRQRGFTLDASPKVAANFTNRKHAATEDGR